MPIIFAETHPPTRGQLEYGQKINARPYAPVSLPVEREIRHPYTGKQEIEEVVPGCALYRVLSLAGEFENDHVLSHPEVMKGLHRTIDLVILGRHPENVLGMAAVNDNDVALLNRGKKVLMKALKEGTRVVMR